LSRSNVLLDNQPNCQLCLSKDWRPLWQVRSYDWAACDVCGSWQVMNPPAQEFFVDFYGNDYYQRTKDTPMRDGAYVDYIGHQNFIQNNLRQRMLWALPFMGSEQHSWLDVGCAAGFLLDVVRENGFAPYGLDYAPFGPQYAREQLHLPNARQGTLDTIPTDFPPQFQVISFMDVLEHLPNQHEALKRACDLCEPGGYVLGETFVPECRLARTLGPWWHAVDPPNHLLLLGTVGIDQLMTREGFTLVAESYQPRRLSVASLVSKFGGLGKQLASRLNNGGVSAWGVNIQLWDARLWLYRKNV